jgi:hypothetical protein
LCDVEEKKFSIKLPIDKEKWVSVNENYVIEGEKEDMRVTRGEQIKESLKDVEERESHNQKIIYRFMI